MVMARSGQAAWAEGAANKANTDMPAAPTADSDLAALEMKFFTLVFLDGSSCAAAARPQSSVPTIWTAVA